MSGTAVYSKLKYESGVHRVQRVPQTETQGRVHTSTATVRLRRRIIVGMHSAQPPLLCLQVLLRLARTRQSTWKDPPKGEHVILTAHADVLSAFRAPSSARGASVSMNMCAALSMDLGAMPVHCYHVRACARRWR